MQDPSAGVQSPLEKHVHLISSHHYPLIAQANLEQAFKFLIEAPPVVKQIAPMSWTYVSPPADGTVWLEWLSPAQNGGRFPSDGYVWSDPEQSFRHSVNGYTIEVLMHQSGFRPGLDHMTAHARTRYHFIAKAPHVNAAAPDPSLWIVHYHHAPQQRILPTSQVQLDHYTRHIMNERAWLERQGRIERRDFMLHDREHWPTISIPSAQQPQMQHPGGYYMPGAMQNQAMMVQNRYGQPPFPQPGGPPSAKRQRTQGPGNLPGPVEVVGQDYSIEDEEFTAHGDYFDHLTPREISLTRFQQHQAWMEEVFQSPHALQNIIPVDLGLGLMGELKGLTEGILQPPALDELLDKASSSPSSTDGPPPFTNLAQDQLKEFTSRVQKFVDEGNEEMERLKAVHAAKLRDWRKTYKLTQAESQLRSASWEGHESGILRATTEEGPNDRPNAARSAHVEDVIGSVEQLVGLKVKPHTDATLVEKGGLQRVERQSLELSGAHQSQATSVAASEVVAFQQNASGGQSAPSSTQQAAVSTIASEQPNTTDRMQNRSATASVLNVPNDQSQGDDLGLMNDTMDIDTGDLEFDLHGTHEQSTLGEVAGVSDGLRSTAAVQPSEGSRGVTHEATAGNTGTKVTASTVGPNNSTQPGGEATRMFNESNFDFGNDLAGGAAAAGDDVGDGLIDFGDEDGMGIGDSAFGDALHGMDS